MYCRCKLFVRGLGSIEVAGFLEAPGAKCFNKLLNIVGSIVLVQTTSEHSEHYKHHWIRTGIFIAQKQLTTPTNRYRRQIPIKNPSKERTKIRAPDFRSPLSFIHQEARVDCGFCAYAGYRVCLGF